MGEEGEEGAEGDDGEDVAPVPVDPMLAAKTELEEVVYYYNRTTAELLAEKQADFHQMLAAESRGKARQGSGVPEEEKCAMEMSAICLGHHLRDDDIGVFFTKVKALDPQKVFLMDESRASLKTLVARYNSITSPENFTVRPAAKRLFDWTVALVKFFEMWVHAKPEFRIWELNSKIALMVQQHKELDSTRMRLTREKEKAQAELRRSEVAVARAGPEIERMRQDIVLLSRLEEVQTLKRAKADTEAAVGRVTRVCDATMLPGVSEWLEKNELSHFEQEALQWCAARAAANVDDVFDRLQDKAEIHAFVEALSCDDAAEANRARQSLLSERRERLETQAARDAQRQQLLDAAQASFQQLLGEHRTAKDRVSQMERAHRSGRIDYSELEQVKAEARRAEQAAKRAKKDRAATDVCWLVTSTPLRAMDGFDIFGHLKELGSEYPQVSVACDWPGSPNARSSDGALFDQLFCPGGLIQQWKEADMSEAALKEIGKVVQQTLWWQLYKGAVKGALRTKAHGCSVAKAVCIEGGPISRVEAMMMSDILQEVRLELKVLNFKGASLQVVFFPTPAAFEQAVQAQDAQRARLKATLEPLRHVPPPEPEDSMAIDLTPQVSAEVVDSCARRWKQRCDKLHQTNETLWLDVRQSNRTAKQTSDLVLLQLEAEILQKKTTDMRRLFENRRANLRSPSTGSLPSINA